MIIGNAAYETSPLKNPANDATDVAAALRELGFKVKLVTDGDQLEMGKAITAFGSVLKEKGGTGLFFYAGHGMQVNGRNYLIPVASSIEAEDEVPYRGIDVGMVLSKMESAGNPMNIIILDACRNNPFARSFRSASRGLVQMDAPTGSLIVYSTAPGSVASDGTGRNGTFTEQLLANMATPNIDVELMLRKVRSEVYSTTEGRQTPWSSSSLQGAFVFNPRPDLKNEEVRIVEKIVHRAGPKQEPFLGVRSQDVTPEIARAYGLSTPSGAMVTALKPGGPGAISGLKQNDVVLKFNGQSITSDDTLKTAVSTAQVGTPVTLEVFREGRKMEMAVIPGSK
ncbi:MAG: hypothetical protein A2005_05200 [Desulfuromonadales bacterium GWC2_61_20]|nr:MAG: hypothetical protein A2005_05200 [Desulfuromonadales bacterium GWC2_61_20]